MTPDQNPLPWLIPGTAIFAIVGIFASRPLSRILRTGPFVAWMLAVSIGAIVFATLTPLNGVFEPSNAGPGHCDLSVMSLIPLESVFNRDDRALNVLLFIPLGVSLGFLPWSRRTAALLLLAFAAPFVIEWSQLVLPSLNRACESGDVIDNLTGLVAGLAVGSVIAWSVPEVRPPQA
jgi:glycopeptide antibiotics resistance protein